MTNLKQVSFRTSPYEGTREGYGESLAKLIATGISAKSSIDKTNKKLSDEEDARLSEAEQFSYNNYIVGRENKRREAGYYKGTQTPEEKLQFLGEERGNFQKHLGEYKSNWFKGKSGSINQNYDKEFNDTYNSYIKELSNKTMQEQAPALILDETTTAEDYNKLFTTIKGIDPSITDGKLIDATLQSFKNQIGNISDDEYTPSLGSSMMSGLTDVIKDEANLNVLSSIVKAKNDEHDKIMLSRDNDSSNSIMLRSTEEDSNIDALIKEARTSIGNDGVKYKTVKALQSLKTITSKALDEDVKERVKDIISLNNEKLKVTSKTTKSFWSVDADNNVNTGMKNTYSNSVNAINNLYFDRPEKAELEVIKLDKLYENSIRVSQEVEEHDVFMPTPEAYGDESKKIIEEQRSRTIAFHLSQGETEKASRLIEANGSIPQDISIGVKKKLTSKNPDEVVEGVNTLIGLERNGNVSRMIRDNRHFGDIFSYAEIAVKNGMSDKEINVLNKIVSGEKDYSLVKTKGYNVIKSMGITEETSSEYQAWLSEANYLASLDIPDDDIETLLTATMENKRYYSDKHEAYVFYPPKWATNDVIDKTVDVITADNPSIAEEGFSFKSSGRGSDELVIYIGQGDKERPIAYIGQREYLALVGMYKEQGLDEEYNKQQFVYSRQRAERNYRIASSNNKNVSGKSAEEWKNELRVLQGISATQEFSDVINGRNKSTLEKLLKGESLR